METKIEFANDQGEKLQGTVHRPEKESTRAVILGHCFTCSRHTLILRRICQSLQAAGFIALRFDFSGNGQSEGSFTASTYTKQIGEMKRAVEVVRDEGAEWIGLCGHSLGGMVGMLAAPGIPLCRAVCAIAPRSVVTREEFLLTPDQQRELVSHRAVSFQSRGRSLLLSEDFFRDAASYSLIETVGSMTLPLLLVHGDRDEITSSDHTFRLAAANPAHIETVIVRGADHMFSLEDHRADVARTVTAWFTRWGGV